MSCAACFRSILLFLIVGQVATFGPSALAASEKNQAAINKSAVITRGSFSRPALPDQYFRLLEAGADRIEKHLAAQPHANLQELESHDESWRLLSHAALVGALLYSKRDPANPSYMRPRMLALATRIGDLLAEESELGRFEARLNSDRDVYVWLETYRLLKAKL